MTRDELIAQLRDIHLPPAADTPAVLDFSLWPIVVFAVIWAAMLGLRYWRRNAWRRDARDALRSIEADPDRTEQWATLLDLAVKIAHVRGRMARLPEIAYRAPDQIDDADTRALIVHLRIEASR